MRLLKRIIIKVIHSLGYDITPKGRLFPMDLETLAHYHIRTIIDIGANRGQFAKKAIAAFPEAKLYCFEPLEEAYRELEKWAHNFSGRIKLFKTALGNQEGGTEMFLHQNHDDSSSLLQTTGLSYKLYPKTKQQKKITINQTTLDKALINLALQQKILIKMDVQGYEDRVIMGGQKIIRQAKACILEICLDKLYEGQADFKKIFLMMDKLGFIYAGNLNQASVPDGHIIYIDALFVKNDGRD